MVFWFPAGRQGPSIVSITSSNFPQTYIRFLPKKQKVGYEAYFIISGIFRSWCRYIRARLLFVLLYQGRQAVQPLALGIPPPTANRAGGTPAAEGAVHAFTAGTHGDGTVPALPDRPDANSFCRLHRCLAQEADKSGTATGLKGHSWGTSKGHSDP